jgi:branched-chain amino acid transport system ATP-binding protein
MQPGLSPLLQVDDLWAGYGLLTVVRGVSLDVNAGEVVGLIGRNGAGKTTTLLAVAGIRNGSNRGSIVLGDVDISRLPARDIVRAGIAVVPEGHPVFREMTVIENLRLGAFARRKTKSGVGESLERVFDLFPVLSDFRRRTAGTLSGGQQQMLAIGQALMQEPRVLMLDEPSSGLAPRVVDVIYDAVGELARQGQAVLVVEQNVDRAIRAASRIYVMEQGTVKLETVVSDFAESELIARLVMGVG